MRRIFWNPITALVAGACLRLLFILKFPMAEGDSVLYEQLATNLLKHRTLAMDVAGTLTPVDLRMPGYPAFLAFLYALTGRTGADARLAVMLSQAFVDLASCLLIASLAGLLTILCSKRAQPNRAFMAALWLSALCPFTANYVAVPMTEVWALFFNALAMVLLVVLASIAKNDNFELPPGVAKLCPNVRGIALLAGFSVGLGTLFRPETPLLLVTTVLLLAYWFLRRGQSRQLFLTILLLGCGCVLPLMPWIIRNAITLHEFQPLAPKDATLPGELVPKGFMAWERTWLYRLRDCYLVAWKLNDEEIHLDDIPSNAFDTPEERERVAAVLETYNDEITWTAEEDTVFAQLANERTARHPLRTYLWIPARRAVRIWFTPRIQLIPVSGNVFPLRYMAEEDPIDQRVTIAYFFLNIFYLTLGLFGAMKLGRHPHARAALMVLLFYVLVRTGFLTLLETPEPRYVLVCFPMVLALGAQLFTGRTLRSSQNG
jgi:4-amino-4-deoxy-L-arabinose transferase-like glycosyltransferase